MTIYKQAKAELKSIADNVKRNNRKDKQLCRQVINDSCDTILRNMPASISESKKRQYENWLSSYAADLHP